MSQNLRRHRFANQMALGIPAGSNFKLGLFVAALQALCAVALMGFSAWLISRAAEQPPVMYLMVAVVCVRAFALGRASFRYGERLLLHNAAFRHMAQLRPRLFAKLIPLAPAGLGANRAEAVTRLVNDVDETQNLALRVLAPVIQAATVVAVTVAYLYFVVPLAALQILLWCLVAIGIALPLSTWLANRANNSQAFERADLNHQTLTLIENIDVLQAYQWLPAQLDTIREVQDKLNRLARQQALSSGLGQSLFLICAALATGGSAYFAALTLVTQDSLPRVMLAVFALVPIAVFDTLNALQPVLGQLRRYRVSANRVLDILDSKPDALIAEPETATNALDHFANLELKYVSAKYPGAAATAVSGLNLQLQPAQTLLLSGPSGAGKSTVANVLLGFLNPVAGEYLINGTPRQTFSGESLRKVIGYQEQNPTIFGGTLRTNLLLAKPAATDSELWAALERVKLASMFEAREGLDTQLGERGFAISGGEAQRVALARMLLADFQVLIFDEPTANVDPETGDALIEDLLALASVELGKSCIFISHDERFESLVDQVVRL